MEDFDPEDIHVRENNRNVITVWHIFYSII